MKCLFPVENSHFGRPKTNFSRFEKSKKKKKKKRFSPHLVTFPPSVSIFHLPFFNFLPFLVQFLIIIDRYCDIMLGSSAFSIVHAYHAYFLRVRTVFHKTVRVCHVYCNFKIGFTCRIPVIFGTLKDGSLLINTLASNICFNYRNVFQNGVDALSKIVDAFFSKSSKFYLVRII